MKRNTLILLVLAALAALAWWLFGRKTTAAETTAAAAADDQNATDLASTLAGGDVSWADLFTVLAGSQRPAAGITTPAATTTPPASTPPRIVVATSNLAAGTTFVSNGHLYRVNQRGEVVDKGPVTAPNRTIADVPTVTVDVNRSAAGEPTPPAPSSARSGAQYSAPGRT